MTGLDIFTHMLEFDRSNEVACDDAYWAIYQFDTSIVPIEVALDNVLDRQLHDAFRNKEQE